VGIGQGEGKPEPIDRKNNHRWEKIDSHDRFGSPGVVKEKSKRDPRALLGKRVATPGTKTSRKLAGGSKGQRGWGNDCETGKKKKSAGAIHRKLKSNRASGHGEDQERKTGRGERKRGTIRNPQKFLAERGDGLIKRLSGRKYEPRRQAEIEGRKRQ